MAWTFSSQRERMINATTKCIPIPDPDLIKSCCHHLLFLIPLQYLYLLPPSYKEREKKNVPCLWMVWSGCTGWTLARRHLLLIVLTASATISHFSQHAVRYGFSQRWPLYAPLSIPSLSATACSHDAVVVITMLQNLFLQAICNLRYCVIELCS